MATKSTLKNISGVCLSFTSVFGSYLGILSLQSSINNEQGLGLVGGATVYLFRCLTLVVIPALYSQLGSKYSVMIGYTLFIVYAGCNYYPSWYTIVPGSMVMGVGLNFMFVSSLTHTSETAKQYAESLGKSYENTIALFLAMFSGAIKGGNILGSLVSSSILYNVDYSENDSYSGLLDQYTDELSDSNESTLTCNNPRASYVEQNNLYYVLISVYVLLGFIGIFLAATLLNNNKVKTRTSEPSHRSFFGYCCIDMRNRITDFLRLFTNYKMLLMFPLFVVNGISIGFIAGKFTKVFVSDCIGVEWIGIAITAYSLMGLVMGIFFGWLRRLLPPYALVYVGVAISETLALFLLLRNVKNAISSDLSKYYIVFGCTVGWGISDGIWQTVVTGIVGSVFSETKNAAFAMFEFGTSIGLATSFLSGIVFSTSTHLWMIFSIILYACVSYTFLLVIMICERRKRIPSTAEQSNYDETKPLVDNTKSRIKISYSTTANEDSMRKEETCT